MSDIINVYIPDGDLPPRVQADFTTASGGEAVIWQVFNANPNVQQVQIEFPASIHYFDPPQRNQLRKQVPPGTCTIFHGQVPIQPAMGGSTVRSDKYDVIGLNGGGTQVSGVLLDPEIIVKVP